MENEEQNSSSHELGLKVILESEGPNEHQLLHCQKRSL